jgi:hypothetical protein
MILVYVTVQIPVVTLEVSGNKVLLNVTQNALEVAL